MSEIRVANLKVLTTLDLTSLGVGSCVGTGMYLVAGMVAHKVAGPSVVMSFIVAAVASLFSGVCYAEFGVRVPHTTGSAYMYSYVTVGEFIAFVIGWNMVLEYLIGTAAGACAISACVDAITGGTISLAIRNGVGTLVDGDRFNSCQVIYSQFGLAIHQNDPQARRRFVEWAQNEIAVAPDFHKRILFSDEAHFWLNGYVNKQNCRIWCGANPQVYVETSLHPENLTV
ncbi:probable cationic amino acid transporter [Trichonephila clavipes]|nr:probable cationic amino acid transporter [Trichonephila clavipes]